jgi:hypothetical protein
MGLPPNIIFSTKLDLSRGCVDVVFAVFGLANADNDSEASAHPRRRVYGETGSRP